MKTILMLSIAILFSSLISGQDVITKRDGTELQTKVVEIGVNEIKYKNFDNLDGPDYVCLKSDVFMIKFENGNKEVFGNTAPAQTTNITTSEGSFATIYFLRPKKFSASRPEIIVGTIVPDEVIVKLKNGRWHKLEYPNLGTIDFVYGIYAINPEKLTVDIKAGETYYFYCEPYEKGLTLMADVKLIDKETAEIHMSELKEQQESLAD